MTTDTQPLTASTPADATLRDLARTCQDRASQEPAEGAEDLRPIWRFAGYHAHRLNQLLRKLHDPIRAPFTASHLCTGWTLCAGAREGDDPERASWRCAYRALLGLLQGEAGILPSMDPAEIA